jgi:hypothetical protein
VPASSMAGAQIHGRYPGTLSCRLFDEAVVQPAEHPLPHFFRLNHFRFERVDHCNGALSFGSFELVAELVQPSSQTRKFLPVGWVHCQDRDAYKLNHKS